MDNTTVFSKTGKGLLEVKNRSNRITKEQYRVLSLVDGKANLDNLEGRARIDPPALRQILSQLSDGGYIKVLVTSSTDGGLGAGANTGSYYVDDLDFTAVLGPASSARPSIYQSTETERRQRESAERKVAEAAATKQREEDEQRQRREALRRAEEETQARKIREDAQRKGLLEAQRQAKLESELKNRLEADRLAKDAAAKALRAQAEAKTKTKAEIDRQAREVEQARLREEEVRRKVKEDKEREERKRQEEIARKRTEEELRRQEARERMLKAEAERQRLENEHKRKEEDRKRNEEEDRKQKEEEDRKRQEEARRRQEEQDRKKREEQERQRREEEERVRREEEARRKAEEEERKRREEEERKRREEEDRLRREEEARRAREDAERKAREAQEKKRREDEERVRAEEEARRKDDERKNRQEEQRKRKEEEDRARSEQEERTRREAAAPAPAVEWPGVPTETRRDEASGVAGFGYSGQSDGDTSTPRLDLPEVIESELPVVAQAAATGITQDDIRRALEEQERRLRMEEEARASFERAEMEAQLKAEREAREMAEALEKARRDAELRAREESERLAREEKERREIEEQERRKQKEAERRAREQAHLEAERRKREEDLARKRKEQEQKELNKAQRERIQKDSHRTQITPARVLLGGVLMLVLMGVLVIQFATLSPWAADMEKIASQRIGEVVHVGALRATVFPRVQLILEKVTVGSAQDVRAASVTLVPEIDSLFSETKILKAVEIQGLTIGAEGLVRAGGWFKGGGTERVRIPLIKVKDATLDIPGVDLPSVSAQIQLGNEAEVLSISAGTMDERLQAEFLPRASNVEVSIKGHNFTMPVGPAVEVMDLQGTGTISAGELRMTRLEYFLFGGQGSAEATVRWQDGWAFESTFDFQRLSLETAMRAFKIQVISDGALDAKGIIRMRSPKIEALFLKPQIDASFTVRRGNLAGFDVPRALQQRHRDGVQGGKTRFEELSGTLTTREGTYQYRQVQMTAGVLRSNGQVDILPSGSVSGRISAELRSSAGVVRGNFTVSGNDQATMLKP